MELSSSGAIKVFVPEIAYDERRTQWRDDYAKAMSQVSETLARYASDAVTTEADRGPLAAAAAALPSLDAEARSQRSFEAFFKRSRFAVIPVTEAHAKEAFRRYFVGETPFKGVKNRADIPDGFILAAMVQVLDTEGTAYCLCSDGELSRAVAAVHGAKVLRDVKAVLEEPDLIALRDELETGRAWNEAKGSFPMARARQELTEWMTNQASSILDHRSVRSEKIPSDDQEGVISFHDDPSNVTISEFHDWGGGAITASASFTSDVELEFAVFRGDAYTVPEWVSVSEGDFEKDHYFEATGAVRIKVELELSFQAMISADYENEEELIFDVGLDREPRVTFLVGL